MTSSNMAALSLWLRSLQNSNLLVDNVLMILHGSKTLGVLTNLYITFGQFCVCMDCCHGCTLWPLPPNGGKRFGWYNFNLTSRRLDQYYFKLLNGNIYKRCLVVVIFFMIKLNSTFSSSTWSTKYSSFSPSFFPVLVPSYYFEAKICKSCAPTNPTITLGHFFPEAWWSLSSPHDSF